jgi:hypothetical protein
VQLLGASIAHVAACWTAKAPSAADADAFRADLARLAGADTKAAKATARCLLCYRTHFLFWIM